MPLPKVVYFFPQDANDINSKAYRCSVYCGCDIDDALILFQWEGDAKSFASAVKSLGSDSPISYTGDRDSIRQWLSGQQSQYGAALMAIDPRITDGGLIEAAAVYDIKRSIQENSVPKGRQ